MVIILSASENIGIYNYYESLSVNNKLFGAEEYPLRDDIGYPFFLLKEKLYEKGVAIDTLDMHPMRDFKKIIFLDYPDIRKLDLFELKRLGKKLYLVIFESEMIRPSNWRKENHLLFEKIFTWHDELVDGKKYIHFKWPNKIPDKIETKCFSDKKLCVLIAGNKKKSDERELYSERKKAIKWFEKNKLDQFDLYGIGWDMYNFKRPFGRLNKFEKLRKMLALRHKSYIGKVDNKIQTLRNYKFCICYENARNIPGYITEKIFDCFFSGCVPIYLGAPNIAEYIPQNCFIDRNQFASYDELYRHLFNMDEITYSKYLDNIAEYLKSESIRIFSADFFSDIIIKNLNL